MEGNGAFPHTFEMKVEVQYVNSEVSKDCHIGRPSQYLITSLSLYIM